MNSIKNKVAHRIFSLLLTKNYTSTNSCVTYPKNATVYGNHFNGKIAIGKNSKILRTECYGQIDIGDHTALNGPNLSIYAGDGKVAIGNFCSIARNVSIQLDGHNYNKITSYQIFKNFFHTENTSEIINNGDMTIGNDVWIGANAMIYGNVSIGDGAVIGSNSFVNKDVPDYAIVVGSPAKIIKYRFEDDLIKELKQLKWWHWDEQTLRKNQFLFENELTLEALKKIQL
ncbi:CatB-related O-acetyltransferase [Subsaximicrobium wynnwilliamsii]|uniref:CatB-related O-acetyltransferase n=1 Tax=Subsaximicrobium wynnwilliamsii TaxID=291179 RepID=A0A5C6ZHZ1_9FLAO|nr:CatB-related O-acetyltransferase [Subsaximicrobium wynnwilliamsii]TXD89059.1 CatB-related O-acetyltransferase [Subsaximicrobium wynnwilliamsii]TXE00737.1 CatB-related O-acetyltransferase [Subsaximicrobium wynnwilliamsii]